MPSLKLLVASPPKYGTFTREGTKRGACRTFCSDLFTAKSVDALETDSRNTAMKRKLNWLDVTLLGIGATIGSGIFVLSGQVAGNNAGPAVVISFIIAGMVSGLAAMCYSEMASMIPVAGSSYTYAYATMGELMAWCLGWDMILEYIVGAATVSVGWSSYVTSFISDVGGQVHDEWTSAPVAWNESDSRFYGTGKYINVPAIVIILVLAVVLIVGIRESSLCNGSIVTVKLIVILIFIFASIKWINPENWKPFVPPEKSFGHFGVSGIFQGATIVFFAYTGFNSVAATAQECRNPQRDLPIGILSALIICIILYIGVAICLTGLMPYKKMLGGNVASPIAKAAQYVGQSWLAITIEAGAIVGLGSVILTVLLSLSRIMFSMARDGLLPFWVAYTNPRFGTPVITTVCLAIITALFGALLPIGVLGELSSIGTLFAYVLVSLGVMILRIRRPDLPRKFKVPFGPYVIPLLSTLCSGTLVILSTKETKIRLAVWMAIGLIIYFAYGRRHSKLQNRLRVQREYQRLHGQEPNEENSTSSYSMDSSPAR